MGIPKAAVRSADPGHSRGQARSHLKAIFHFSFDKIFNQMIKRFQKSMAYCLKIVKSSQTFGS